MERSRAAPGKKRYLFNGKWIPEITAGWGIDVGRYCLGMSVFFLMAMQIQMGIQMRIIVYRLEYIGIQMGIQMEWNTYHQCFFFSNVALLYCRNRNMWKSMGCIMKFIMKFHHENRRNLGNVASWELSILPNGIYHMIYHDTYIHSYIVVGLLEHFFILFHISGIIMPTDQNIYIYKSLLFNILPEPLMTGMICTHNQKHREEGFVSTKNVFQ